MESRHGPGLQGGSEYNTMNELKRAGDQGPFFFSTKP